MTEDKQESRAVTRKPRDAAAVQPNTYAHGTSMSRTDGRTDGRITIAIPRCALRASRGRNWRKIRKFKIREPKLCQC